MVSSEIDALRAYLRRGGLIAYPTESCYGLGCDPRNLRALKRLIAFKDRKGRIPAVEIMLNTPLVQEMIFKGNVPEIREVMKREGLVEGLAPLVGLG